MGSDLHLWISFKSCAQSLPTLVKCSNLWVTATCIATDMYHHHHLRRHHHIPDLYQSVQNFSKLLNNISSVLDINRRGLFRANEKQHSQKHHQRCFVFKLPIAIAHFFWFILDLNFLWFSQTGYLLWHWQSV